MRKKANITITILTICVVLLCSLALVSFILSKAKILNVFTGVYLVEELNSQIEDYSANEDISRVNSRINSEGKRVIYQEKIEQDGFWLWKKDKVALSIEYELPN